MPKRQTPTYYHYKSKPGAIGLNQEVGTDHDYHNQNEAEGSSVNVRLARSRAEEARSTRSARIAQSAQSNGQRVVGWNVDTSCMPLLAAWPDFDISSTTSTQPRRRAAGPSAPPSWRNPPKVAVSKSEPISQEHRITRDDLIEASSLFTEGRINASPVLGARPLSHYIYRSVIQYLDCPEVYWIDEDGTTLTASQYYRKAVRRYEERFKVRLLANHSSHPNRISDETVKAILSPPIIMDSTGNDDCDWDTGPLIERIHHLGITLHPDPYRLLKSINPLPTVALTSLDLAYSVIPHIEKLVEVLPLGMKELGLVGVKCLNENEKGFNRMLSLLGKRLQLLHTLDLSHSRLTSFPTLGALLHPPERQLPSLRKLGLRGVILEAESGQMDDGEKSGIMDVNTSSAAVRVQRVLWVKEIMLGRNRYVDVIWE